MGVYLLRVCPDRQPAESRLYLSLRKQLEAVDKIRQQVGFECAEASVDVPTAEEIDALPTHLRNLGSAEWGFGTVSFIIETLPTHRNRFSLAGYLFRMTSQNYQITGAAYLEFLLCGSTIYLGNWNVYSGGIH